MTQTTTMAAPQPPTAGSLAAGRVALRACGFGLVASGALVAAVVMSGLLPAGVADYVWQGFGVAALSGSVGLCLQTWLTTVPVDHPQLTQRYLAGLFGNFLLQLLVACIATLTLVLLDVKFEATAAFALTFAAAATILHTAGVIVVSQALRARTAGVPTGGVQD